MGRERFVSVIAEQHLREKRVERSVPAEKRLAARPTMDEIIRTIKAAFGVNGELTRSMSIYCCQKYSGAKLKEIGALFGISEAAVSQASLRLVLKAGKDQELDKMIGRVETLLRSVRS